MGAVDAPSLGTMKVEVVVPGLEKLVDVVSSGIGSVAGPMLAPWRARKEGEARLVQAESKAKVLSIQAQAQADARGLLVADHGLVGGEIELGEAVTQRIEFQERKRQANIVTVVNQAALELEDSRVPAVEPNHDWTARFFGEVQDVSSADMQVLWGRVLAGEVRTPGTTSMRTLGILKDVDATTARLFSRLCSAALYLRGRDGEIINSIVPSLGGNAGQNSLGKYGFGFGELNRLNEHGLIIADYNSYHGYVVDDSEQAGEVELYHQGVCWDWDIQGEDRKKVSLKLHGVAMTVAGCELSRVVSHEAMEEYTEALKGFLQRNFRLKMRQTHSVGAPVQRP